MLSLVKVWIVLQLSQLTINDDQGEVSLFGISAGKQCVAMCLTAIVSNYYFTIIAEIYARSLVNFYCQYADRHMNDHE